MFKTLLMSISALVGTQAISCPKPLDVQDPKVKDTFDMKHFLGTYYEIAYHDYTQPIGVCGCQRSVKTLKNEVIFDDFTLNCGSTTDNTQTHTYHNNLTFVQSEDPGVWDGKWPKVSFVNFPDTLIDFGPINEDGQYAWVLEFQCDQLFGHTLFVGINFYSSVKDHRYFDDIAASIEGHGLHEYAFPSSGGPQVTKVNHTGCSYNNTHFSEEEAAEEFEEIMSLAQGQ